MSLGAACDAAEHVPGRPFLSRGGEKAETKPDTTESDVTTGAIPAPLRHVDPAPCAPPTRRSKLHDDVSLAARTFASDPARRRSRDTSSLRWSFSDW